MSCRRCNRSHFINLAGYCAQHWIERQYELKKEKIDELKQEIINLREAVVISDKIIREYHESNRQKTLQIETLEKDLREKTLLLMTHTAKNK